MLTNLLLLLALLIQQVKLSDHLFYDKVAIQTTNSVFYSFLPYISQCKYNQQNVTEGSVTQTLLTPPIIFQELLQFNTHQFWAEVQNGYDIMLALLWNNNLIQNIIYSDTRMTQKNRKFINFTIQQGKVPNETTLIFSDTSATININTMTVNFTTYNNENILISPEARDLLGRCPQSYSTNFAYIGNQTFFYECGPLQQGFIFQRGVDQTNSTSMINLQKLFGPGKCNITSNPQIINGYYKVNNVFWNFLLLYENQTDSELYVGIIEDDKNVTFFSYEQIQPTINDILNQIWGHQIVSQQGQLFQILADLSLHPQIQFPGKIVSLYFNPHQLLFIESNLNDTNYLCTFDTNFRLLWNISYQGNITLYGQQSIIINTTNNQLYKLDLQRPIYKIDPRGDNYQPNSFTNFTFVSYCQNQTLIVIYEVLWTSQNYPSSLVTWRSIFQNSLSLHSNTDSMLLNVDAYFKVFGPDFQLKVSSDPNIKLNISDSEQLEKSITKHGEIVQIISVTMKDTLEVLSYKTIQVTYCTKNSINVLYWDGDVQVINSFPCGFNNISTINKNADSSYTLTNVNGLECICSNDFTQCAYKNMQTTSNSTTFMTYELQPIQTQQDDNVLIKQNLFGLIDSGGYIIQILTNNSLMLINVSNNILFDIYTLNCSSQNMVEGIAYNNPQSQSSVFTYCTLTSSITQLLIVNNSFLFQRQIPIYQFAIKFGRKPCYDGDSYVYIEVDPITNTVNDIQQLKECCIIAIDPYQYTVSVIRHIIFATSIIKCYSFQNLQFALFQTNQQYILHAFLPHNLVLLTQTNYSMNYTTSNVSIYFISPSYNFATSFVINITFNLTKLLLSLNIQYLNHTQFDFQQYQTVHNATSYKDETSYDLTKMVCGPIFTSHFQQPQFIMTMSTLSIVQQEVITKSKVILSSMHITLIQIIDLLDYNINNSLSNFLFIVSKNQIFVYQKIDPINQAQVLYFDQVDLPQNNCLGNISTCYGCKYYPYQQLGTNGVTFVTDCIQNQIVTLIYHQNNSTMDWQFSFNQFKKPLKNMQTIFRGQNLTTYAIGVQVKVMSSSIGSLLLCDYQQSNTSCSTFSASQKFGFLGNYATSTNNTDFIVISIDFTNITIYLNPNFNLSFEVIQYDYTINYIQNMEDQYYCSEISIIRFFDNITECILSCKNYYYHIIINFNQSTEGEIKQLHRFARYPQCQSIDQYPPQIVKNETNFLAFMAVCRKNLSRPQYYQIKLMTNPILFNGYIQAFTLNGPRQPQYSCNNSTFKQNSFSPQKIINISTTHHPLYKTYTELIQVSNTNYKFVYQSIDGVLIDNFVYANLEFGAQYTPFTDQHDDFKAVIYHVWNPFTDLQFPIKVQLSQAKSTQVRLIMTAVGFAVSTLITLVCLIGYIFKGNQKIAKQQMQSGNQTDNQDKFKFRGDNRQSRQKKISSMSSKRVKYRYTQMEVFSVRKT